MKQAVMTAPGEITLNNGRTAVALVVTNTRKWPALVGRHQYFSEPNLGPDFDRAAHCRRLDIPVGAPARFEPGQSRKAALMPYARRRRVFRLTSMAMGAL